MTSPATPRHRHRGPAQYLRLVTDLQSGSLLDQPAITTDRYVRSKPPAALRMAITSPTPAAGGTGAQTVVTGTAPPGATVVISVGRPTSPANSTAVVSTAANAAGRFQATVQTAPGTIVVTATAALGAHATGWTQLTVKP